MAARRVIQPRVSYSGAGGTYRTLDEALGAARQRQGYGQGLGKGMDVEFQKTTEQLAQGYQDILAGTKGYLAGQGKTARQDIAEAFNRERSRFVGGMVASGLYGSTVTPMIGAGITGREQRAYGALDESINRQMLGVTVPLQRERLALLERRGPSYGQYAQLQEAYGAYGGGGYGGATMGDFSAVEAMRQRRRLMDQQARRYKPTVGNGLMPLSPKPTQGPYGYGTGPYYVT